MNKPQHTLKNSKEHMAHLRFHQRKTSDASDLENWTILEEKLPTKKPSTLGIVFDECKNQWTAFSFLLKRSRACPLDCLAYGNSGVTLLGKTFTSHTTFLPQYSQLIYFSYRKGMETPIRSGGKCEVQDTNWGCSIRCCQMFFAQVIQRMTDDKIFTSNAQRILFKKQIIRQFLDDYKHPFSIHNICEAGKRYNTQVGEYWRPLTAILCLGALSCSKIILNHDNKPMEFPEKKKHNKKNSFEFLKQYPEFNLILCKDNLVNFVNINNLIEEQEENEFTGVSEKGTFLTVPFLVVIVAMFGDTKVNSDNYYVLSKMMELKSSVGMIGGVQNQAYYIVGRHDQSFIILDPHSVNPSERKLKNYKSYYPHKDAILVKFGEFDACLNAGFLLKTKKDLDELEDLFAHLVDQKGDNFYITPRFSKECHQNKFKNSLFLTTTEGDLLEYQDSDELIMSNSNESQGPKSRKVSGGQGSLRESTFFKIVDENPPHIHQGSHGDFGANSWRSRKYSEEMAYEMKEETINA